MTEYQQITVTITLTVMIVVACIAAWHDQNWPKL